MGSSGVVRRMKCPPGRHTGWGDSMYEPLWTRGAELPVFSKLEEDIRTDVLIIGGGLAGLLCAYRLEQAGVDYALVEADRICRGVTRNTTAKVTAQHGLIYHKLLRRLGPERAKLYLLANQRAVEEFRGLSREISCDFEEKDSFVYSLNDERKLEREMEALERLHAPAELVERLPLPFETAGAVRFPGQGQFHPLKFAARIARNLRIYEQTPVREFRGNTVTTPKGTIRAEKMIICTHFPILNKHGSYFLKQYQHRSYVLGLEGAPTLPGMYVDEADGGLSLRNAGGLLLLGGGGHRTGKEGGGWRELRAFTETHWPDAREKYRWAAQDCMTLDGAPYIGPYSARTPDLFVATGFNKWGMTSSMVSAMILTDLVQGQENSYAPAFAPSRSMLRPQLAVNALESTLNLLTPTTPRCPHMGCALKWNRQEHSWDCPCHGSRFDGEGNLLDGPATGDLEET